MREREWENEENEKTDWKLQKMNRRVYRRVYYTV